MRQFEGIIPIRMLQISFSNLPDEKEVKDRVKILIYRL